MTPDTPVTSPSVWGPPLWTAFHEYAINLPPALNPAALADAEAWYRDFASNIPCETCRVKYTDLLSSKYGFTLWGTTRESIFEWTVTLHNVVNMWLKKRLVPLEEATAIHWVS